MEDMDQPGKQVGDSFQITRLTVSMLLKLAVHVAEATSRCRTGFARATTISGASSTTPVRMELNF